MELIVTTKEDLQQLIKESISTSLQELQLPGATQPIEIVDVDTICSRMNITPPTWRKWRKLFKVPSVADNRFVWHEVIEALKNKRKSR